MSKLQIGINDLATTFPNLLSEWCYSKNIIDPSQIYYGSSKKMWWKCNNGHEWEATIVNRTKGIGCPYCSGRKPIKGINDLLTVNPELCMEWDYEANGKIIPEECTAGSSKKVWWICQKGHKWETSIYQRNKLGTGCPYCSGRLAIQGENDIFTLFPNLIHEWNYEKNIDIDPTLISAGSEKKVWWKCSIGHEWQTVVSNRIKGTGCPICSNRYTLAGYNDLKTWCLKNNHCEVLNEWNYDKNNISPEQISPQNSKKVWWRCNKGHEWQATIGSRTSKKMCGCPYCSYPVKKILVGYNDFETKCKDEGREYLLYEWNYERNGKITPQSITYSSGKRLWWKCSKGHEWITTPAGRSRGTMCPVCSRTQTSFPEQAIAYYLSKNYKILQRFRIKGFEIDVFLEDYNIGIEYDGMRYHKSKKSSLREKKKDLFYKSNNIILFHLKEDNEKNCIENNNIYFVVDKNNYLCESFNKALITLIQIISQITKSNYIYDVDIKRDELLIRDHYTSFLKENSVASVYPELVSEWDFDKNHGLTPDNFSFGAHTKIWWKCDKGHSWQAVISSRSRGLGCPYCAGQKLIIGENDLESWCKTNNPTLLNEWDYKKNSSKPSEMMKTSNKKFWWKCAKGHGWEATIANRVHGTKCPYCNTGKVLHRKTISLKEWCISTNNENLLQEWDYDKNLSLTPDKISKGSHVKVWWKCKDNHSWEAQVKSRTYNHGCPYCSGTFKKVLKGQNDLVTWCKNNGKTYILMEWDYNSNEEMTPEMFTFGSHKRINWKCSKGHKWEAVIKERTKQNGNMCPVCRKENQ